jgi:hypothetical protein
MPASAARATNRPAVEGATPTASVTRRPFRQGAVQADSAREPQGGPSPSPFLRRSDLAEFLVDVLEQGLCIRQAPLVGAKSAPDGPVPE